MNPKNTVLYTFERLTPRKLMPAWIFWVLLGLAGFFAGDLIISVFNEQHFRETQILFAAEMVGVPVALIYLSRAFQTNLHALSPILWDSDKDFSDWVHKSSKRLFTLQSKTPRFVILLATVLFFVTVFSLGLPFESTWLNIIALIGMLPIVILNGQSAYIMVDLLFVLSEIVSRNVRTPFYFPPNSAVKSLLNYYSVTALLQLAGYTLVGLGIWSGPYGVPANLKIWLGIGAFYPFSMFLWSFWQTHILMDKVKQRSLELINQEIQKTFTEMVKTENQESVGRLEKMMTMQDKVSGMSVWALDLQGSITFIITLGTAIIQAVSIYLNIIRP